MVLITVVGTVTALLFKGEHRAFSIMTVAVTAVLVLLS